jgi:hypothetical protein
MMMEASNYIQWDSTAPTKTGMLIQIKKLIFLDSGEALIMSGPRLLQKKKLLPLIVLMQIN